MERLVDAGALIVWLAVLAALVALAVYVIGRVRAKTLQQEPIAHELLAKFRDLHSRGELSDAEFRTIKTALALQRRNELSGNDETG
jgi:uncharacterized membrane protein